MSGERDWAIILRAIYEDDIWWQKDEEIDENHPVVQAVDMDVERVQSALAYLYQVNLIGSTKAGMGADVPRPGKEYETPLADHDKRTGLYLGLTSRGFSVAHDREIQRRRDEQDLREAKQQHDVNLAVAILSLGLISVTVVDSAVRAFVGAEAIFPASASLAVGVLLLIGFGIILYRNGLLTRFSADLGW
jgi:hypothetical protein